MLKKKHRLSLVEALLLVLYYRFLLAAGRIKELSAEQSIDARKLQAAEYLRRGNVDRHQINRLGLLDEDTDPYADISTYFGAYKRGELVCASRVIFSKDYGDLQISKSVPQRLIGLSDTGYAELSGVVKSARASNMLVPAIVLCAISKYSAHRILCSVTSEPYSKFKLFMGPLSIPVGQPYKINHGNNIVHPVEIVLTDSGELPLAYRLLRSEVAS